MSLFVAVWKDPPCLMGKSTISTGPFSIAYLENSMAMTQDPIDWRYRFHIRPIYISGLNFREDPQKI